MSGPLLEVDDLTVRSGTGEPLVDGLSLQIRTAERVALIGESGSGKSLTSLAVLGLLPEGLSATGAVRVDGVPVLGRTERVLGRIRGRRVGIVFQEPLTALDPLAPLGRQVAEPLRRSARAEGRPITRAQTRAAVLDALREVRLRDPERIARSFPHQVSGGQRQRVAIAMALAGRPALLIADEPTTALDVTVQAEVLELLERVVAERGTALLFISHDLAVVSRMADRASVLLRGRQVETGSVHDLIDRPAHPYTRRLVDAARELDRAIERGGAR